MGLPFEMSPQRGLKRQRSVDVNVEVWVRVRPLSGQEQKLDRQQRVAHHHNCVRLYSAQHGGGVTIFNPAAQSPAATYRSFGVDRCLWSADANLPSKTGAQSVTQSDLYTPIGTSIQQVIDGFNLTIMAYGQVGSGKTHTMFGGDKSERGVIHRAVSDLLKAALHFNGCHKHRFFCLEIGAASVHKNEAYDLLKTPAGSPGRKGMPTHLSPMPVHVTAPAAGVTSSDERVVHLPDMTWHSVFSEDDAQRYLSMAQQRRQPNAHCIVMVRAVKSYATSPHGVVGARHHAVGANEDDPNRTASSTLCFVDLAGAEDLRKGESTAAFTSEAVANNKSLSVLRLVLERLAAASKDRFAAELSPPYRESVLTKMLVNSLGGNCRTILIAHVSPHPSCYQGTYNTLRFADAAKAVLCSVSFAVPSPACDERVHELRRALEDPWLDEAHRSALQHMLTDEMDEMAQYDTRLQRLASNSQQVIAHRKVQQDIVQKYNTVTANTGQQTNEIDAQLEEAQGTMKRLMDRLHLLESKTKGRQTAASLAIIEAERDVLRSQLEKAAEEKTVLRDLKNSLMRKLATMTLDTVSTDEDLLERSPSPRTHEYQQHNDTATLPSSSPPFLPWSEPPLRHAQNSIVPFQEDGGGVGVGSGGGDYIEPGVVPDVWIASLAALSVRVEKVVDDGDVGEAKQLAVVANEMAAAHPKFRGLLHAVAQRLDSVLLLDNAPPPHDTLYGRSGSADAYEGHEVHSAAVRVTSLLAQLSTAESEASKYMKEVGLLQVRVHELTASCTRLVTSAMEARKHDLNPAAAAALAAGLAEVNFLEFTSTQGAMQQQQHEGNDIRVNLQAFKGAVQAVFRTDTYLSILPPAAKASLQRMHTLMERMDHRGDVSGQLAVVRAEMRAGRRDVGTFCDVSVTLDTVKHETALLRAASPAPRAQRLLGAAPMPRRSTHSDLPAATSSAAALAVVVRRDDTAGEKVKEVSAAFTDCGAPQAAALSDEAGRRLALGDCVGAAAALHAAAAAGAADLTMSVTPHTTPTRLAGLLAELAELQRALSRGEFIEVVEVERVRDHACLLSGLGPGCAEQTMSQLAALCGEVSVQELAMRAAAAGRRHPVLAGFAREMTTLLQSNNADGARGAAERAVEALVVTRHAALEVGEAVRAVSVQGNNPTKIIERAADATKHARLQHAASPVATLLSTAEAGLGSALCHVQQYTPHHAVDDMRAAVAAVGKATCTGVASAAVLARKLAASCAEMRGRAAATAAPHDIQALSSAAADMAQEATFAAEACHPGALLTGALEVCAEKLRHASDALRHGVVTQDACEALGKAGAAAWSAAEGHNLLKKATATLTTAATTMVSGDVIAASTLLREAVASLESAENGAQSTAGSAMVKSITSRLRSVMQKESNNVTAAEVTRIRKDLSVASGEPGADEIAARVVAERLNELLRGLDANAPLPELVTIVKATMTEAAEVAEGTGLEEASAMALQARLEGIQAASLSTPPDPLQVAEVVSGLARLGSAPGVLGNGLAAASATLASDADVTKALSACSTALSANTSLIAAARTLDEMKSGHIDATELVLLSGEVSLIAGSLGEDGKELAELGAQMFAAAQGGGAGGAGGEGGVAEQQHHVALLSKELSRAAGLSSPEEDMKEYVAELGTLLRSGNDSTDPAHKATVLDRLQKMMKLTSKPEEKSFYAGLHEMLSQQSRPGVGRRQRNDAGEDVDSEVGQDHAVPSLAATQVLSEGDLTDSFRNNFGVPLLSSGHQLLQDGQRGVLHAVEEQLRHGDTDSLVLSEMTTQRNAGPPSAAVPPASLAALEAISQLMSAGVVGNEAAVLAAITEVETMHPQLTPMLAGVASAVSATSTSTSQDTTEPSTAKETRTLAERLRAHDVSALEEAKAAASRMRSSSIRLTGLADDADRAIAAGDMEELALILDAASRADSAPHEVPEVKHNLQSLRAAVVTLRNKVAAGQSIPKTHMEAILVKGLSIGGVPPDVVEATASFIGFDVSRHGATAARSAGKRHGAEEFGIAAGCLEEGDAVQAGRACEAVASALCSARLAVAGVTDAAWLALDGRTEALQSTAVTLDAVATKLALTSTPQSMHTACTEAATSLRALHTKALNGHSNTDIHKEVLDLAASLQNHLHLGAKGHATTMSSISKSLSELGKALGSDLTDRDMVAAQLKWLGKEAKGLSNGTLLGRSAASFVKELSAFGVNDGDAGARCVRAAAKLRNSVDAQGNIAAAERLVSQAEQHFLSGSISDGLDLLGQAVDISSAYKATDVYSDLTELSGAPLTTPAVLLAEGAHSICASLRTLSGSPTPQHHAASVLVARLNNLPEEGTPRDRAAIIDTALSDALAISGVAAAESETTALLLSEKLWQLEEESDPLTAAAMRDDAVCLAQPLSEGPGVLGPAMKHAVSLISTEAPDSALIVESSATAVTKLRSIANILGTPCRYSAMTVTADELSLLGGTALSAVSLLPEEAGTDALNLAEQLSAAAAQVGKGLGVDLHALHHAAVEAAGLSVRSEKVVALRDSELLAMAAMARSKAEVDGSGGNKALLDAASVLESAAHTGDITTTTLAAVATASSANGASVQLEALSAKIGTLSTHSLGTLGSLLTEVSTLTTQQPSLRSLLHSVKEDITTYLVGNNVEKSLDAVLKHEKLNEGDRSEIVAVKGEVVTTISALSDACAAALHSDCSEEAKRALRTILTLSEENDPSGEAVLAAAEEAMLHGCAAPLVGTHSAALKTSLTLLGTKCLTAAQRRDAPPELRHSLLDIAVCTAINAEADPTIRQTIKQSTKGCDMQCLLSNLPAPPGLTTLLNACTLQDDDVVASMEAEILSSRTRLIAAESAAEEAASALEAHVEETDGAASSLREELASKTRMYTMLEEKLESVEGKNEERGGELVKLEDACAVLEAQMQAMELTLSERTSEVTATKAHLDAAASEIAEHKTELLSAQNRIVELNATHEATIEQTRVAMDVAMQDTTLNKSTRQAISASMTETMTQTVRETLQDVLEEHDDIPPHLREAVKQLLVEGGDLEQHCEAAAAVAATGVVLPQATAKVLDACEQADIKGGGLGAAAALTSELAALVRRGSGIEAGAIRTLAQNLLECGDTVAASLAEEAARRLESGDTEGASRTLIDAAGEAAARTAHGVPVHPRLAGLLADLAELHRRLSAGEVVSKSEITSLRSRALENAALGSGAAESCARFLARAAGQHHSHNVELLAKVAQDAIQRYPEETGLLTEYAALVVERPQEASAIMAEAGDIYEDLRLLAVQTGEIARRLQLGECGVEVNAETARAAGTAQTLLQNTSHPSEAFEVVARKLADCVELQRAGGTSTAAAAEAAEAAELAASCGLSGALRVARKATAYCRDLSSRVAAGTVDPAFVAVVLDCVHAELRGTSHAAPSRSIVAIALTDATHALEDNTASQQTRLDHVVRCLQHACDAQDNVSRCMLGINEASQLLSECGGVGGGVADQDAVSRAAEALTNAGNGAAAASAAARDASLTTVAESLTLAAEAIRSVSARCAESIADASQRAPSTADVLAVNAHLVHVVGRLGGDEAASRLIAERLRLLLEGLRHGRLPVEAAEVLEQHPPPEAVAAAAAATEAYDTGPSASESTALAMAVRLRGVEEQLLADPDGATAELVLLARTAQTMHTEDSIVGRALATVETLLNNAISQQHDTQHAAASVLQARELCDGAAEASHVSRCVARALWGVESCVAHGIAISKPDMTRLAEESRTGASRAPDAAAQLDEVATLLDTLTDDASPAEVGRLCDLAAQAAGLPFRGAVGAATDLKLRCEALIARDKDSVDVAPRDVQRLAQHASSAASRYPTAAATFSLIASELTGIESPPLHSTLQRASRLAESLGNFRSRDFSLQWPDGEGLLSEEADVRNLRASLGQQMKGEMEKLNKKWRKKLSDSETAREELQVELVALIDVMAETEIQRDTLLTENCQLEEQLASLQVDAVDGIEDIIGDRDEDLLLHKRALEVAARIRAEGDEGEERLQIEVSEQSHIARILHLKTRSLSDNLQQAELDFIEGQHRWEEEELRLTNNLQAAASACSDLEGAVSRREEEAQRLQLEIEQVVQAVAESNEQHEDEIRNLDVQLQLRNQEIQAYEAAISDNNTAGEMHSAKEHNLRAELEKQKELCSEISSELSKKAHHEEKAQRELAKLRAEKASLETVIEELTEKLAGMNEDTASLDRSRSETNEKVTLVRTELAEATTQLAKEVEHRAKLEEELASLEEDAAEALSKEEEKRIQLEADLKEAHQYIEELTEALETA